MTAHLYNAEITSLVAKLGRGRVSERIRIADELVGLSVKLRGGVLPRGRVNQAASLGFPSRLDQRAVLGVLDRASSEQKPELCAAMIAVLGAWGDQEAVPTIVGLLNRSTDREVQSACIYALKLIGGRDATLALKSAAQQSNSWLKGRAEWSLRELETGGTVDGAEGTRLRAKPETLLPTCYPVQMAGGAALISGGATKSIRYRVPKKAQKYLPCIAGKQTNISCPHCGSSTALTNIGAAAGLFVMCTRCGYLFKNKRSVEKISGQSYGFVEMKFVPGQFTKKQTGIRKTLS